MKTGSTLIWRISSKNCWIDVYLYIYIKLIIFNQWECFTFFIINNLKNISHDRTQLKSYEKFCICPFSILFDTAIRQCYEFWHKTENGIWCQIRQFVRICLMIFYPVQYVNGCYKILSVLTLNYEHFICLFCILKSRNSLFR